MKVSVSRFPRAGLRARLLMLVSLALLPILALIVWMNVQDRREKTSRAYDEIARVVRLAVSEQSREIDAAHHLLVDLSRHPEIWTPADAHCSATLRELIYALPAYVNLGVARPDGAVPCVAIGRAQPINFADREWFQRAVATQQMVVAGISRGRVRGLPIIVVALPLVDEAGVQAVAYAALGLDWLHRFAREARLGDDATFTVVDAQGTVVTGGPHPDRWLARAGLAEPLVRDIVTTRRGTVERPDLDGLRRLYAFAPLVASEASPGIYLAIGIPSARAFAAANQGLVLNLAMLAVAAALTFAVAWTGGTALILNAVRNLLAAARRLGSGELATRVQLSGHHGELTELGHAFDEMAAALEQRDAELAAGAAARRAVDARLQWATIAETSGDAIIGVDPRGAIFSWNAGAETLFGYAAGEVVGRPIGSLVPSDQAARVEDEIEHVRHGARPSELETAAIAKDGRRVEISCTLSLIPEPALGISMIARDMTARRWADARRRVQAAALEAAANGIVITDAGGVIAWVNPAFTAITGYTLDEAIGGTPRLLRSGRHEPEFYQELWATIRAGRVWHGEMVNRRKDGTLYDEEQTITPVRDSYGAITHFVAIKQDVTARRQAREALRRSEEHFRSLIENALDVIFVVDPGGAVRYASPSVERVLGYRPEELMGRSAFALLHPDDLDIVRALFVEGVRTSGSTGSAECRIAHQDGSWRTIEAIGRNLVEEPEIAGVVINARDITERKRVEEAHQRLQRQLAQTEKLAAMSDLLAGVAHELNNPLSVVIGYSAILHADVAGTVAATRATRIAEAAERCARIVRNFLALARQHAPERVHVDLRRIVQDTVEMMGYPLRVDNVEVALDLPDDGPLVPVDPHAIQQVLVNLITNAHHALRGVTAPRRLAIGLRIDPAARQASLAVRDTGPGMPPEVERRLFEPFFTTKPAGQGTGLGLPICRSIVESHGGRIEVDTAPGRGTCFTVVLPLDASVTPARVLPSVGPARRCRVLVVDDEPAVLDVLTAMLRADGHEVDSAPGGKEALVKIEAGPWDAILSDVKMPGLDGSSLYREVTRRYPSLKTRFIFVTGNILDPATLRFLEDTGAPSFSKPFGLEMVRTALATVVAASTGDAPR